MRLFLSSYRFGDHSDELLDMVGEDAHVTVITNAKDYKSFSERRDSVHELFDTFKEFGMTPHELDLRNYFTDNEGLEAHLKQHGFVWLTGGNSFVLRRALHYSGCDTLLTNLIGNDEIIYGGESAGAIMASPTLKGVEFEDDPYNTPEGYTDEDIWTGLGFVSFAIVPYFEAGYEEHDRTIDLLEEEHIPYQTLRGCEVIVVNGEQQKMLS